MSDTEILDGEINLRHMNDNVFRKTKLPDTLFYNPDLVQVTVESSEFSSNLFVENTDEVTVEPLEYDIRSLNEFGYVMAHLLIRSYSLYKINHTHDDRVARYTYSLDCVGKLPRYLYRQLSRVKPILPKDTNEAFDIMGIQVYLNEGTVQYPKDKYAYRLSNRHCLEVTEDASVADIVRELMKYVTELTINLLGYEPKFDFTKMDKLYRYKK
ncbi:MAG: hypothetical protein [Bacteriophage sp.]|nr:MAG: hypothetical protein [Bacteriophage sp.]